MSLHETPTAKPGFIDRIRDLIAKVFGSPSRAPQGAGAVAATSGQPNARPAETTIRALAPGPDNATT